jgi:hypothetical protein
MSWRKLVLPVLLGAGLWLAAAGRSATTNLPTIPSRLGVRTNSLPTTRPTRTNTPAASPGGARTNAVTAGGNKTNGPAAGQAAAPHGSSQIVETFRRLQTSPSFYPALGISILLIALVLYRVFKARPGEEARRRAAALAGRTGLRVGARKVSGKPIHSCNVLEMGGEARQIWQFDARGGSYVLSREQVCLEGEGLPRGLVAKDWRSLFQPRLNVAWLPPENVFLRVAQLPKSDFAETVSMVELQMEKLSPMPVAQIVWSFHALPHPEDNLQTVIVMVVARSIVEEFLGKLETQGYLADRLELPLLDQIQTTAITEDGAWIYPDAAGGKNTALVAWWYGGVLRSLDLVTLPPVDRPASLRAQLMQLAWAGELEGWLSSPPEWHVVADVAAAEWEPALREGLGQPVEAIRPLAAKEVAALTARRSAQSDPEVNLLPGEFAVRYQQQFVDRLWMRGLLALGALYAAGVAIYMVILAYASFNTQRVEQQVAALGPTYTNAVQLRDRFRVLKDRQELKYAGLDCWNTTARLLPENATLESINFTDGKRLTLSGSAPADQIQTLYDFERDMRKATVDGQPLFDESKGESLQFRAQGASASWTLVLELKRTEVQ